LKETAEPTLEIIPRCEIPRRQLKQHYYTIGEVFRRYSISQKTKISYGYLVQVQKHLKGFVKFLKDNGIGSFYSVREHTLIEYQEFLWSEIANRREENERTGQSPGRDRQSE